MLNAEARSQMTRTTFVENALPCTPKPSRPRPCFDTEEIASETRFEALAPEWAALWRRDPRATPFQHPDWLLPWWTHCGGGNLAVYAGRRHGRLVALLPMFRYRDRLLPLGIGISDYHDVLLEPGTDVAPLLARMRRPAELHELRPDSPLRGSSPMSVCPVLTFPPQIPSKKRRDLRRARRAAADVSFEGATAATLPEHLEALMRLHGARWRSRGEMGVLFERHVQHFHAAAAPRLLAAGIARFHALRIDGAIRASWYVLHAHRRVFGYLAGFDPEISELQPGTLLMGETLDEALREGCQEFDFLRGGESYKYLWGAVDRPNYKRVLE
jgi:CelD/BcsL family acetyltransferase involved in cellulose biosynthesis